MRLKMEMMSLRMNFRLPHERDLVEGETYRS